MRLTRGWKHAGKSVYTQEHFNGTAFVWRQLEDPHKGKWMRTDLPCFALTFCAASVGISPLGIFSKSSGPFRTCAEAMKGKSRRCRT